MSAPARRSLASAAQAMKARVLAAPQPLERYTYVGGCADSREVKPQRLFFALPGERVDGFAYCGAAAKAGAAAVVVAADRGLPAGCEGIPVLAVDDPRRALGDLARAVRAQFAGQIVGVTGSNGKTTTKELIAAALAPFGTVLRTSGNLNTDVGLPLTILESTGTEAFWVLEMAMRARGEIAYLAEVAAPAVGVVTNVAAAHLGRLGSLDEVARAKGEIFHGLGDRGIAVLPAGDPRLEPQAAHLPESRKVRFAGPGDQAPGRAVGRTGAPLVRLLDFVPAGAAGAVARIDVAGQPVVARLPLTGEHNARNAATALAVVVALGLPAPPAAQGMEATALPPHRSRLIAVATRTVLDDCYNANPASMSAALATVASSVGASGRPYAVLGDMLELGDDAVALHQALGREVVARQLGGLVAMGPLGTEIARGARQAGLPADRVATTDDPARAAELIAAWTAPGDWILIKASRGMRLERVIDALERHWAPPRAQ